MSGRQLGDGKGKEVKMTRGADSRIKAGQRKPGLETISKLPSRGSRGEDKSWSGNKDTRKLCRSPSSSACVRLYSCKHLFGLSHPTWSPLSPSDQSLWVAEALPDGCPSFTSMPRFCDPDQGRARVCCLGGTCMRTASTWQPKLSARSEADQTQMAESGRRWKNKMVFAKLCGQLANVPTKQRLRGPTTNMFTQIPGC